MLPLIITFIVIVIGYYIYGSISAKKPTLYAKKGSRLKEQVIKYMPCLKESYQPPWFAQNPIFMTFLRTYQSEPSLPWEREIVTFPDGGIAAMDWIHGKDDDAPLLILMPGLAGHTHKSPYLWNPAKEAASKGWNVLVINRRGHSVPLKTPKLPGMDNSDDVSFILENFVASRYPKAFKIACGFSMGGMILVNYLGTRTKENAIIDVGISVSTPFDPHATFRSLSNFSGRHIVSRIGANALVELIKPHKEVLEKQVNWDLVMKSKEVGLFDHRCTAPLNGFTDVNQYYFEAAPYRKVSKILIPFLILSAEDDPMVPTKPPMSLPFLEFDKNENIVCVLTSTGGHSAFMETSDVNASGFVEKMLFEWIDMHLKLNK